MFIDLVKKANLKFFIASFNLVLFSLFFNGIAIAQHGHDMPGMHTPELPLADVPMMSENAIREGADLDGDGDADEVFLRLEVLEIIEEIAPGKQLTFWVFAPEGRGLTSIARLPSPTIRVEEGDIVKITLVNTHYFPHTIHFHGTIHPNAMDGVPHITQPAVKPGETFDYVFKAVNPGTHFYHCHVHPHIHIMMGLRGMFIIEPNRPNNHFSYLIIGAGHIPDMTHAVADTYDREYSLVYADVDAELHSIPQVFFSTGRGAREIEREMHRVYDITERRADFFTLNGRSYPFTLRDSQIIVNENEKVRLRILNAGASPIALHPHGHHPTVTHLDGFELNDAAKFQRDVFTISPAQRIDLTLDTTQDGKNASGPGVWLMHDHTEPAVSTDGIGPGGDVTTITYQPFLDANTGLPMVVGDLSGFFDPAYFAGQTPVFDPEIFNDEPLTGDPTRPPIPGIAGAGVHQHGQGGFPQGTTPVGEVKHVTIRGGVKYATRGEVYGFDIEEIHVEKNQPVEITFINEDPVRHAFMIPDLEPIFLIEVVGPDQQMTMSFIAPDIDATLELHCHVERHRETGMIGQVIVGTGGEPVAHDEHSAESEDGASDEHGADDAHDGGDAHDAGGEHTTDDAHGMEDAHDAGGEHDAGDEAHGAGDEHGGAHETPSATMFVFEKSLVSGLNIVSLALQPVEPLHARGLADQLEATVVVRRNSQTGRFEGFTPSLQGRGFPIEGGSGYIVNLRNDKVWKLHGKPWGTQMTPAAPASQTPSTLWAFMLSATIVDEQEAFVQPVGYTVLAKNLRTGVDNVGEAATDAQFGVIWADLSRREVVRIHDDLEISLLDQHQALVSGPIRYIVTEADIQNAFARVKLELGNIVPEQNVLLQNYPNPFNPETWIPFRLSESADVQIHIYDQKGGLIRTLSLGHLDSGSYVGRNKAAYWDGRNNLGESVPSGMYFYTLKVGDELTDTRKFVILK
jgi:manganese oxidase